MLARALGRGGRSRKWPAWGVAAVVWVLGSAVPAFAYDKDGFPTTVDELQDWFPAQEEDGDPLSHPGDPETLQGPSMPKTLQDQAREQRENSPVQDTRPLEDRELAVLAKYYPIVAEVKKALKQKVAKMPPPPDYELECNDDPVVAMTTEQLVKAYAEQAGNPELDLLKRLLEVRREMQLLGLPTRETFQAELAERLMVKTRDLIQTYGKDRNKVLSILGFAHRAHEVVGLMGGGVGQSFYAEIAAWLKTLMPELLRDLRDKHDYRAVSAALALAQAITLAGDGANVNPEAMASEIERAMTFDLSLELWVKSTGANGSVEEWWLSAKVPLKARMIKGKDDPVPKLLLEGEGNGRYDRYLDREGGIAMKAPGFETIARVREFDACKGTGVLALDRMFADTETYSYTQHPSATPDDLPMMHDAFIIFFDDKRSIDGYEFKVPVVNLVVEAIDTVIQDAVGVFDLKLTVKMKHTPK